ncbi:MAG: hypothetical protein ACTHMC_01260 [Pseudobacter sp.]|uniref:hypothetical protein n=1 Tax=Pseudobacter sp. TaxID=2045420 RepID=UPI003F7FDB9A
MTYKLLALLLIIFLSPFIGGLYGVLHDQLTYTISPEYYTRFKFYQFGLWEEGQVRAEGHRLNAAVVGFLATWWMGIPIGIIIGAVGLLQKNAKRMLTVSFRAMGIVMVVALLTGLLGLAVGYTFENGEGWWLPEKLVYRKDFIAVGSMHNYSYLGGLVGLVAGIIYMGYRKRRYDKIDQQSDTSIL